MADVVREFSELGDRKRTRRAETSISEIARKRKEVVAVLTPPLCSVGFRSAESAPRRGEDPRFRSRGFAWRTI